MGKSIVGQKDSSQGKGKKEKLNKAQSKLVSLQRSKQKYVQFFEFLKEFHESKPKEQSLLTINQPLVKEVSHSVMHFFNHNKIYTTQELERFFIYLANLLNLIPDERESLRFQPEFKTKIRRFLNSIVQARLQGKSKNSKIHALLYILTILIYKEKLNQDRFIQQINRSIYSDRCLVKLLLSLAISPKYKRMSKFYGVIVIYLTSRQNSKKIKQAIIKSILLNIAKVDHQTTFFNFLAYLRSEKNKVKISYEEVKQGQIFQTLMQAFSRYKDKAQSCKIIDYLNYLLNLFPALAQKIPRENFLPNLMLFDSTATLHYPLQQSIIVSFVKLALKYSESNASKMMLGQITNFILCNKDSAIRLGEVILDNEVSEEKMMELLEGQFINSLLRLVNNQSEENVMNKSIKLIKKTIKILEVVNKHISEYISYQLECRLKIISSVRHIRDI